MLVTIFDSNGSAVIDSIGAQLISYKDSTGKETIWQRDPKFWNRCSPLLFPIVGNCRNNKTIIEGKTYCIEKHGFCRDVDFQVTSSPILRLHLKFTIRKRRRPFILTPFPSP